MFRRFLTIFVIVGFLAGQWAAVPHAHAGASQAPGHVHSAAPHLHLSWFFADGHPHEHSHSGHDHGDCDHHEPIPVPTNSWGDGENHDADAFYLPTGTPLAGSSDRGRVASWEWQATQALPAVFAISDSRAADRGQVNFRRYPPETRARQCALYLELRTLRI